MFTSQLLPSSYQDHEYVRTASISLSQVTFSFHQAFLPAVSESCGVRPMFAERGGDSMTLAGIQSAHTHILMVPQRRRCIIHETASLRARLEPRHHRTPENVSWPELGVITLRLPGRRN